MREHRWDHAACFDCHQPPHNAKEESHDHTGQGLRKGLGAPYPSPDILRAARDTGVSSLTFGSDCHLPDDVGDNFDACLKIARDAGFENLAVFEARRSTQIPIEEFDVQGR